MADAAKHLSTSAYVPEHWRRVVEDDLWSYEIKIDNERVEHGTLPGKGLPVVDRIVAMLPDLLVERPHAGSLEISIDCVPF